MIASILQKIHEADSLSFSNSTLSQCNGSLYGVHMVTTGQSREERGVVGEMTHILMKAHNDFSPPVLILHEAKPNVVDFSCRKSSYTAEMTISL